MIKMSKGLAFVLFGFLILILSILSPFVFIWSLNTLFALNIAYGFFEWLAALVFLAVINGSGIKFKKE